MTLRVQQAEWVLRYLAEPAVYRSAIDKWVHDSSLSVNLTYDDDLDFVEAFVEEFPGRFGDSDKGLKCASRRLRLLLNDLTWSGLVERLRCSNDFKYSRNDPSWQNVYRLRPRTLKRVKLGPFRLSVNRWADSQKFRIV